VLRTFAVAAATLSLIGGAAWSLQAVSLARPSAAQIELVKTLHALTAYRGSNGMVKVDGWRYRSSCIQHWYPGERVARVLLDPRGGAPVAGSLPLGRAAFELAGCPRPLAGWLASELVRGASVTFRKVTVRGVVLHEFEIRPRTIPIDLYVSGSDSLPVRLKLSAAGLRASSVVHYDQLR
jgi:hypothetical protein